MTRVQRSILQSLLKTTERTPPEHRLEELQVAAAVHLGLYKQERNQEMVNVWSPLAAALKKAKTVEEVEAMMTWPRS